MNPSDHGPLGQPTAYAASYDARLLFPMARQAQRDRLCVKGSVPFMGADLWTAYELSWLNARGKPQVALVHLTVPCETPNIVESKSLKLYLNSFNQTVFASVDEVQQRVRTDLSEALWRGAERQGQAGVRVVTPEHWSREQIMPLDGLNLDRLDVECTDYEPRPSWLQADHSQALVEEVLVSDLLRSQCPVTSQPDWGSVRIAYTGAPIDQAGLLRYIVSFRLHSGFHEHCVEQMFMDIWTRCRPARLSVLARYTRRGGLDISPWRTSHPQPAPAHVRTARQ